jgi:hypothetical protein
VALDSLSSFMMISWLYSLWCRRGPLIIYRSFGNQYEIN